MEQQAKQRRYFGGINCDIGYLGFYDSLFPEGTKVYSIKGTPGCGKSHLMKRVAKAAKEGGEAVHEILCGSDPTSLDGIYLPTRGVAMVDGTAPHLNEPKMPFVDGELIDLSRFLDGKKLAGERERIRALNREKGQGYASLYRLLGAMRSIRLEMRARQGGKLDLDKMEKGAKRTIGALRGEAGEGAIRQREALTMMGLFSLPLAGDDRVIGVRDGMGGGAFYLRELEKLARAAGMAHEVSFHPIFHDEIAVLSFPSAGLTYSTRVGDDAARYIHMRRFLSDNDGGKGEMRDLGRMNEGLLEQAKEVFSRIRAAHFGLEEIYAAAVDFEREERFEGEVELMMMKE